MTDIEVRLALYRAFFETGRAPSSVRLAELEEAEVLPGRIGLTGEF